ncbi:MAG: 50S ribosomal protein L32 [Erysipelotrichales bacterium]|nr:50S ribosomal protein L32 [Erysipelotrichales bacterium]
MAVPFRRTSKSKKRMRRSHQALTAPGMIVCPSCGEIKLSHRVCGVCGKYKDKEIVTIKEKKDE